MSAKPPTAKEKYEEIFGRMSSLSEPTSWSEGLSNMIEWLTWNTAPILGITKTTYRRRIMHWSNEPAAQTVDDKTRFKLVESRLRQEMADGEGASRYERPKGTVASPREALRRAKYFLEDYLNKEFDICWSLVSDAYLDAFYSQFTALKGGGEWSTHGNSSKFSYSTAIHQMQMDNLSYNPSEKLLIANELKLGGRKNPDQILKYALMFNLLRGRGFIDPDSRFLLLFIGDCAIEPEWDALREAEIAHCRKSSKKAKDHLLNPEVLDTAKAAECDSISWEQLIRFNEFYARGLHARSQQVERKLLLGFNESLLAKAALQVRVQDPQLVLAGVKESALS